MISTPSPRGTSAALTLALLLAACGGGGGGSTPAPTPAPPPPAPTVSTTGADPCTGSNAYGLTTLAGELVGKQAAAAVVGCTGAIVAPEWTQTAGPAVALLSAKSQVIHFEPAVAGTYGFRVRFTDPSGTARTEDLTVAVTAPAQAVRAVVRNHQAVRMGGKISLRAWAPTGESVNSVSWVQTAGPTVSLQNVDPLAKQFVAPEVARDTVLRFRATVTTANGASDSHEALVLVERHVQASASDANAVWGGDHISRVYAYRASSPYASALVRCTYDSAQSDRALCPLSQLPFLAQDVAAGQIPTVEQVMDRVIVSHDWLGENFEQFLRTNDTRGDFRRMLMSTTAIVLGAHVRPSFYYAGTGAIYLDADNFWLTPEQRDTIDEAPDYRAGFGNSLSYYGLWRYAKDNRGYLAYFDPQRRVTRTQADLLADAGWLMYHELTHALDFMPPGQYAGLNPSLSAWGNIAPRFSARQLVSDLVSSAYPLTSTEMKGLGQVKFQGVTATATQNAYTADQVAGFFSADLATDEYAYSTSREDVAMSVEEMLMSRRLGVQRDVAMVPRNGETIQTSNVRWGQRGRVGDPRIKPRVRQAASLVVPWLPSTEVDALPAPVQMRVGESWSSNLNLSPVRPAEANDRRQALSAAEQWQLRKMMERQQVHEHPKRLPAH
ncbi:hypothetical protein [Inhella crocodyli]|uniref:Uncharacterized protein n=1 Tax=Inhella crocodyli TaxID=2499851 RepID=A0A437LTS9_9BURK|nr:hypothetical protein [Inhella crocodyli]RVT88663.1 hypothetical protein EOD73_06760 [Inhella crocodyli]